jgi:hypothetical protein
MQLSGCDSAEVMERVWRPQPGKEAFQIMPAGRAMMSPRV